MTGSRILVAAGLMLGACVADPAWAVKCLDDPGDAAQIAAARTAVDGACSCFGFASHGEYVRCASDVVNDRADIGQLRKQCRGFVKKIYVKSVCGREAERAPAIGPTAPCVAGSSSSGKVSCAVRPFGSCFSSDNTARRPCFAHTHCLDAADTNGDLRIAAPADTGDCVPPADTLTDNGDGTITDSRTALTWEKLSDDGSIHDLDDRYDLPDAVAVKMTALNSGGGFAGHTDWRVPTIHELMTLLRADALPAVPPEFDSGCTPSCTVLTCSCTRSGIFGIYYWTTTTLVVDSEMAWLVDFGAPRLDTTPYGHGFAHFVRAVRGGS